MVSGYTYMRERERERDLCYNLFGKVMKMTDSHINHLKDSTGKEMSI